MPGGRPKKPTNLKLLEGNPGKRVLNMNEVKPAPIASVCPEWMHRYAKEEWDRMSDKLERLGLLSEIDEVAFSGYCQSYARWREAEEFISMTGTGGVMRSDTGSLSAIPYVYISQKALSLMSLYIGKFGMSPSDRVGLVSGKAEESNSNIGRLLSK